MPNCLPSQEKQEHDIQLNFSNCSTLIVTAALNFAVTKKTYSSHKGRIRVFLWSFQALLKKWKHFIILPRFLLKTWKKPDMFPFTKEIFKKCPLCKKKKKFTVNFVFNKTCFTLNSPLSACKIILARKKKELGAVDK